MIDEAELDKERSVIIEEIRSVQDSPEDLVHDVIDEVVWGDHGSAARSPAPRRPSANIDRTAMVDFWRRNYGPERLVIAAGGDVKHEDVVALTERYFGDLEAAGDPDGYDRQRSTTQTEARVQLINRETEQAHLCLAMPALPTPPSGATCSRPSRRSSPPG